MAPWVIQVLGGSDALGNQAEAEVPAQVRDRLQEGLEAQGASSEVTDGLVGAPRVLPV